MKFLSKLLFTVAISMFSCSLFAQHSSDSITVFKFVPGKNMFYVPFSTNTQQLEQLTALIGRYNSEIEAGTLPVYVDSYSTSASTPKTNLNLAFVMANRVKSYFILKNNLKESNFITKNHVEEYEGHKDLVVVSIRVPEKVEPQPEVVEPENVQPKQEPVAEEKAEVKEEPVVEAPIVEEVAESEKPYSIAIRTNLLYDAVLYPTLGIEWRVNENIGIKLDASYSDWGSNSGKKQKMWMVNPEIRYYLLNAKRFYTGVSGVYGKSDTYKYPLGNVLLSRKKGYDGHFWNAGAVVGYQLFLCPAFSLDFNLGLGYTRFDYDAYKVIDKERVFNAQNQSNNYWGPTQAGINLVWTLGK